MHELPSNAKSIVTANHAFRNYEEFETHLHSVTSEEESIKLLNGSVWRNSEVNRIFTEKGTKNTRPFFYAMKSESISERMFTVAPKEGTPWGFFIMRDQKNHEILYAVHLNKINQLIKDSGMQPDPLSQQFKITISGERANHDQFEIWVPNKKENAERIPYDAKFRSVSDEQFRIEYNKPSSSPSHKKPYAAKRESESHIDLCLLIRNYPKEILQALDLPAEEFKDVYLERQWRFLTGDRADAVIELTQGRSIVFEVEPIAKGENRKTVILRLDIGLSQCSKYRALICAERHSKVLSDKVHSVLFIPKFHIDKKIVDKALKLEHKIVMWNFETNSPELIN